MANVAIFDPNDITVPNRVLKYLLSVNTPDYLDNPNILINPNISSLIVDEKYWKVVSENVVEMTQNEKIAIDNFLQAKTLRNKKFKVNHYNSTNLLTQDTYYDTDNGDGTYSGLAEQTIYTYQSGTTTLLYKIVTTFYYDGTVASAVKYAYFLNANNEIIEKQVGV